ncbi:MAG TPA: PRC-barrel domain-containing protein, partial [Actinomycetes bacterium]
MVDPAGGKIGTIADIYLDDDTGQPEWATVTTGLLGTKQSFVPLAQAQTMGASVRVPYDKDRVKNAPAIPAEGELSQDEEANLYRHYGLEYTESRSDTGLPAGTAEQNLAPRDRYHEAPAGAVGRDLSGPTTDEAMTRSEEELR